MGKRFYSAMKKISIYHFNAVLARSCSKNSFYCRSNTRASGMRYRIIGRRGTQISGFSHESPRLWAARRMQDGVGHEDLDMRDCKFFNGLL